MFLLSLIDRWIGRRAAARPEALASVRDLTPAVVVIGGSRGIGRAIAKRFATAGHKVMLVGRNETDLIRAAKAIAKAQRGNAQPEPLVLAADATSPEAAAQIDTALGENGCYLDILVNSAALGFSGDFAQQDTDQLDDLLELNVAALTRLTRYALPKMLARGKGGIINVASLGGLVPGPYQAAYYASKAYVVSMTTAVAAENAGRGVRIACVLPGPVETAFHADMGANNSLYRYVLPSLSPDDVAAATYRGYRLGHRLIVPGIFSWMLSRVVGLVPYGILVPLMSNLLWPGAKKRNQVTSGKR